MDKLKQEKLQMWKKKNEALKKDLEDAFTRKGEAAREGDLRENAAYKAAIEDIEMIQSRLEDIDKIISDLES